MFLILTLYFVTVAAHTHLLPEKTNPIPEYLRSGIITNGIAANFENDVESWEFMSGLAGSSSLRIEGDATNHYAVIQTHGLQYNIENDNPDSPLDYAIFSSGITTLKTAWFRRYCLEMDVIPNKGTTQFNITAVWSDANEKIKNEYKIIRVYTEGHGDTEGNCNAPGADHGNAVCIPMRSPDGNPVWSTLKKLNLSPPTEHLQLEIKMYKDSDFAFDNVKFTDCSLDPRTAVKPAWVKAQEEGDFHQPVYADGKFGTYYTGMSFAAEEELWKNKRAQADLNSKPSSSTKPVTTKYVSQTTKYQSQTPKYQHPIINPQISNTQTTKYPSQTTKITTTKSTLPRPTLPSDWGRAPATFPKIIKTTERSSRQQTETPFIPFLMDESTIATTTVEPIQKDASKVRKKFKKDKLNSASKELSIYITLLLAILLL